MSTMQDLMVEIVITSEMCGRHLSELSVKAIAEDLSTLPVDKCIAALKQLRRTGKFPSSQDVHDFVNPQIATSDVGRDIASRIIFAISKYGWNNPQPAKNYLGALGWQCVERFGGWLMICETVNSHNQMQITAQLRDLAETLAKFHHTSSDIQTLENDAQEKIYSSIFPNLPQ